MFLMSSGQIEKLRRGIQALYGGPNPTGFFWQFLWEKLNVQLSDLAPPYAPFKQQISQALLQLSADGRAMELLNALEEAHPKAEALLRVITELRMEAGLSKIDKPPSWSDLMVRHAPNATTLWWRIKEAEPAVTERAIAIADRAEAAVRRAYHERSEAEWQDDRALVRCLKAITDLGTAWLRPSESAIALCVPFVYEAVLAAFVAAAHESGGTAGELRQVLQNALAEDELRLRREARLRKADAAGTADALAAWRALRIGHMRRELWDYVHPTKRGGAVAGWIEPALDDLFATAGDIYQLDAARVLSGPRLVGLAKFLFSTSEDVATADAQKHRVLLGEGKIDKKLGDIAGADLARLLVVAGRMALDPRRLPSVAIEHVGTEAGLKSAVLRQQRDEMRKQLDDAYWTISSDEAMLHLNACSFAALDAGLREVVEDLQGQRLAFSGAAGRLQLPVRFSAKDLLVAKVNGRDAYELPHLRFSIDSARILDLLTGEFFYGDRGVALRELFQNALDACRYRSARIEYLRRIGSGGSDQPWEPKITFRQGDKEGRHFIYCEDNGIGMAKEHVAGLFFRAGRRFTGSQEFQLEKARWDRAKVPYFANSRFGIGVLSYFMLADGFEVETRRVNKDGVPGESFGASIAGTDSLVRAGSALNAPWAGGTRVTLWLREDVYLGPLAEQIQRWLIIPEVEVEIIEGAAEPTILPAGRPTPRAEARWGPLRPIPDPDDVLGQPRVYWCEHILEKHSASRARAPSDHSTRPPFFDEGAVLLDGVVVAGDDGPFHRLITGLLINVTRGPTIIVSADRNVVRQGGTALSWLEQHLLRHAAPTLRKDFDLDAEMVTALFKLHAPILIAADQSGSDSVPGRLFEGDEERLTLSDPSRYSHIQNAFQSRVLAGRARDWDTGTEALQTFVAYGEHLRVGRPKLGTLSLAGEVDDQGMLGPTAAVLAAHRWGQPLRYIRDCIESAREAGLSCDPALLGDAAPELAEWPDAMELLQVRPWGAGRPSGRIPLEDLARFAISRGRSLRETRAAVEPLAKFGVLVPEVATGVPDISFEPIDSKLLRFWNSTRVELGRVLAARRRGDDIEQLRASLQRLDKVGLLSFRDPETALQEPPTDLLMFLLSQPGSEPQRWVERVDLTHWARLHASGVERAWLESAGQYSKFLRDQKVLDCDLSFLPSLADESLQKYLRHARRCPLSFPDAMELLAWPTTKASLLPRLEALASDGLLDFDLAEVGDLLPGETFDRERLFAGMFDSSRREVTAWTVTLSAARRQSSVASLDQTVHLLARGGVRADDALAFVDFAAGRNVG
jgi:hypothetical protein